MGRFCEDCIVKDEELEMERETIQRLQRQIRQIYQRLDAIAQDVKWGVEV